MAPLWLHGASMEQPADNKDDLLRYAMGVRELRNNLTRFLAEVKEGKLVVVLDHGHPSGSADPGPTPTRSRS